MRLALANLDTGLFLDQSGWTTDLRLANKFSEPDEVANVATARNVQNAAAAMVDGDPPRVRGFLWLTGQG